MNAFVIPPLGVQLGAAIGFVDACTTAYAGDHGVKEGWSDVYKKVALPHGVTQINTSLQDAAQIRDSVMDWKFHLRPVFNRRVSDIIRQPVTKKVIEEQKINPYQIKYAMDIGLISKDPAMTLIQLGVYAMGAQRELGGSALLAIFPGVINILAALALYGTSSAEEAAAAPLMFIGALLICTLPLGIKSTQKYFAREMSQLLSDSEE